MFKKMLVKMICIQLSDYFGFAVVETEIKNLEHDKETDLFKFTVICFNPNTIQLETHNGFICSTGRIHIDTEYLKTTKKEEA